jgi:hypothetical protein
MRVGELSNTSIGGDEDDEDDEEDDDNDNGDDDNDDNVKDGDEKPPLKMSLFGVNGTEADLRIRCNRSLLLKSIHKPLSLLLLLEFPLMKLLLLLLLLLLLPGIGYDERRDG